MPTEPGRCVPTSGVLVRNAKGEKFMTAAAHRVYGDVFQRATKTGRDRFVGRPAERFDNLDVCLVQLKDSVQFENEVFKNNSGVRPKLTHLNSERETDNFPSFLGSALDGESVHRAYGRQSCTAIDQGHG